MKKSVMQKWVKALRSGKYKQTRSRLFNRNRNSFCCLGVLCEISNLNYDKSGNYLPRNIQIWSGMETKNGKLPKNRYLDKYNDVSKYSFKKIADIIEKYYEEL